MFPFGEPVRQSADHHTDLKKKDFEFAGVQAASEISETSKAEGAQSSVMFVWEDERCTSSKEGLASLSILHSGWVSDHFRVGF